MNDSIWLDVIDFKNGSNLKVYFKNKNYYVLGSYRYHEINVADPWFAISGYVQFDIQTNQADPVINYENDSTIIMTFRLSDVDHIEIF